MKAVWLSNGEFFGLVSRKSELWNKDGMHVGYLNEKGQVFAPDGHYLAELLGDRLVVQRMNKALQSETFALKAPQIGMPSYLSCSSIELPAGYETFCP